MCVCVCVCVSAHGVDVCAHACDIHTAISFLTTQQTSSMEYARVPPTPLVRNTDRAGISRVMWVHEARVTHTQFHTSTRTTCTCI